MPYSTNNPPDLVSQTIGGTHRTWVYKSVDALSLVRFSGYFSNGYSLGMRAGDTIEVIDTDAVPITKSICTVAQATESVVNLSDGTAISSTNTD